MERGDVIAVEQEQSAPGRSFTTPSMMELERETIDRMRAGQGQHRELVTESTREAIVPMGAFLRGTLASIVTAGLGSLAGAWAYREV